MSKGAAPIAAKVRGSTSGLKPSQLKKLQRLAQRRYPSQGGLSREQVREVAGLTHEVGRQLGLLIDRQGRLEMVVVGEPGRIVIPELGRQRQHSGRLRGLRLVHTHLGQEGLSEEDLMDMVFLRLDSITVLEVDSHGTPGHMQWAHLLPANADAKPYTVSKRQPWDRVDIDFNAQAEALEEELARRQEGIALQARENTTLLVSVGTKPRARLEAELDELDDLAQTAGLHVAGRLVQRVARLNPKFILGRGKLAELEVKALQANAGIIIFDGELSPSQMRNLAQVTERKVLDRTQLILDIFAQHATSRAGKLQVEMAQLKYTLPRLVGQNRALSRLAGGIGGRGPGETKLELDRRKVRERITRIRKELDKVRKHRAHTRSRRSDAGVPIVALVGYTNAGKSTLLNTITHSQVVAEDKLFATLDPTSRRIRFPQDREVVLTDTVGFIRELPEDLREAFLATLEELEEADVLIQVADAGHPELEEQVAAVDAILQDMGLEDIPRLLALNKWDTLDPEARQRVLNIFPHGLPTTALDKGGLEDLVQAILKRLPA